MGKIVSSILPFHKFFLFPACHFSISNLILQFTFLNSVPKISYCPVNTLTYFILVLQIIQQYFCLIYTLSINYLIIKPFPYAMLFLIFVTVQPSVDCYLFFIISHFFHILFEVFVLYLCLMLVFIFTTQ